MKKVILPILALSVILSGCQMVLDNIFLVRGTVVDDATGEPLLSVEIGIPGYQYAELTNSAGDYVMETPEGTWDLHFQKDGYESKTEQVIMGPNNPRVELVTRLVPVQSEENWIVGFWVNISDQPLSWPGTHVIEFREDGTYYDWEYYDCTELRDSGNWSLEGNTFSLGGMSMEITKVSDDEFEVDMGGETLTMLRKGTEPNIFDGIPTELSEGIWAEGSIEEEELQLYSFAALSAGGYDILWEEEDPLGYNADIHVWAFDMNHDPFYVLDHDLRGDDSPETITPIAGQVIYIIVEGNETGTYRIRLQPAL